VFKDLVYYICCEEHGFVTFRVSEQVLKSMVYDVGLMDLEKPPPNKLRKVIFKDFCMLNVNEKLKIVGKLIGRKNIIDQESIYQCMLDMNELGKKISWARVAGLLNCSARTVYRNIGSELKKEKELLNKQLK